MKIPCCKHKHCLICLGRGYTKVPRQTEKFFDKMKNLFDANNATLCANKDALYLSVNRDRYKILTITGQSISLLTEDLQNVLIEL